MEQAGPENFAKWVDFNIWDNFRFSNKLLDAMPRGGDWVTYTSEDGVIISLNSWKRNYTDRCFNPCNFAKNSERLAKRAAGAVASTAQRRGMTDIRVSVTIKCGLLNQVYRYHIYENKGPIISIMEVQLLPNGEG